MIVKCIAKSGRDLPLNALVPQDGFDINHKFRVEINKYYVIYAMTIYSGYMWYYLCNRPYQTYPFWNPSPLFEVIDGKLSKYWIYSFTIDKFNSSTIIAFPEWANDPYYYDRLTDGEEKDVEIFKSYKAKMDLEFPSPSIEDKAVDLGDHWLFCHFCVDAWQSFSQDGMVICPKCNRMLHNPYYKGFD